MSDYQDEQPDPVNKLRDFITVNKYPLIYGAALGGGYLVASSMRKRAFRAGAYYAAHELARLARERTAAEAVDLPVVQVSAAAKELKKLAKSQGELTWMFEKFKVVLSVD